MSTKRINLSKEHPQIDERTVYIAKIAKYIHNYANLKEQNMYIAKNVENAQKYTKKLTLIKKYCGDELHNQWKNFLNRYLKMSEIRIVNTGVVSSGKSSIFNALINSLDTERFTTGAARTTKIADEYKYSETINLVDTPGIDVREEDDIVAFETVASADLVMVVHNIKTGVLTQNEVDWIRRVAITMGLDSARERMIFVCSWVDERDKDANYNDLLQDVKNAVFNILGGEIPFFEISAKRYYKGMKDNKSVLVDKSNINKLRGFLEERACVLLEKKGDDLSITKSELKSKTKEVLRYKRAKVAGEIESIKIKEKNNHKSRYNAWNSVFEYFKILKKQLQQLRNEYNNI